MRMPVRSNASILEGLVNLQRVGGGKAHPDNKDVTLFELPSEVDIVLNNREVRTDYPWDHEKHPCWKRDLLFPPRIARRLKEGPRLRDQDFYDVLREIDAEEGLTPPNEDDDWRIDVMCTQQYCSPGCAVVWKGREFIAAIDCRFIYRLNAPDTPELQASLRRSIDEITRIVFEEWRRREEGAIVD